MPSRAPKTYWTPARTPGSPEQTRVLHPRRPRWLHLPRTYAAAKVWAEGHAEREARWEAAQTAMDVSRCVHLDNEARAPLREAFYEDTQHVNGREKAALFAFDDAWIRSLLAGE